MDWEKRPTILERECLRIWRRDENKCFGVFVREIFHGDVCNLLGLADRVARRK